MKISNEVKIGILATLTVVAAIWGYKFLKGENVLDRSLTVYAAFDNVQQINKASPVFYKGAEVGTVKDILFLPEQPGKVVLVINLKMNPGIPKDADAELFSNGVLSGKAININFKKICSGADCAQNGDYINAVTLSALESMIGKPEALDPYVGKLTALVDTLNYSLKQPDNEVGKSLRDIQITLVNLRQATASLSQIMAASAGSLNATMKNVESITGNLKSNNDKITALLNNVNDVTANAKGIDFAKVNKATDGAAQSIEELKKTLAETQKSLGELTSTLKKVNSGEGTIGQFATNDSVYHSLNATLLHTQALMQDLRLNPKRYLNLNPFRKYKPYKTPNEDPLLDTLQKRYNATMKK